MMPLNCRVIRLEIDLEKLENLKCVPCSGTEPALTVQEVAELKPKVPKWDVITQDGVMHLQRQFTFDNFAQALDFTNRVGKIAEAEGHHPAILTEWGRVTVEWWTHKINGLHQNDFVMAAKTDELYA
jgi:4a-hydroxytetrahydrobiopterin dehydratase